MFENDLNSTLRHVFIIKVLADNTKEQKLQRDAHRIYFQILCASLAKREPRQFLRVSHGNTGLLRFIKTISQDFNTQIILKSIGNFCLNYLQCIDTKAVIPTQFGIETRKALKICFKGLVKFCQFMVVTQDQFSMSFIGGNYSPVCCVLFC